MFPSSPQHHGLSLTSQPATHSTWDGYRRWASYALAHWRGWVVIIAVTLSSSALAVLQPWPMKILIDQVLGTQPMPDWLAIASDWLRWADSPRGMLGWIVVSLLAIFAINSVFEVVLTIAWIQV